MHDRRLAAHPHAGDDGFDDGVDQAGYAHGHDTMSLVPKHPFVVECMTELVKLCVCFWMMEFGA